MDRRPVPARENHRSGRLLTPVRRVIDGKPETPLTDAAGAQLAREHDQLQDQKYGPRGRRRPPWRRGREGAARAGVQNPRASSAASSSVM